MTVTVSLNSTIGLLRERSRRQYQGHVPLMPQALPAHLSQQEGNHIPLVSEWWKMYSIVQCISRLFHGIVLFFISCGIVRKSQWIRIFIFATVVWSFIEILYIPILHICAGQCTLSISVPTWLKDSCGNFIADWPTNSPDLNPTKIFWAIISVSCLSETPHFPRHKVALF